MSETAKSSSQEVCIDLPGQPVKCWRSGESIKVILRKHRDVIFELNLAKGNTYTVQATESDFYNARDKKLVYAMRKESVTFRDGERLHLWITRGFKGTLMLKSGEKLLMRLDPQKLDSHEYNDDPKTKPSPIIVALGTAHSVSKSPVPAPYTAKSISQNKQQAIDRIKSPLAVPSAAPVDEECPVVCVVDGSVKGMPEHILNHFKKGGGQTGLVDIDPFDVSTRNWIWGQFAGSAAYVADNWSWLRASIDSRTSSGFRFVSARVHWVRNKIRFYFSGYSKFNTVFKQGGFGPGNERIMSIFAGVGNTSSTFAATAKGIAGSFKSNALVSFIFGSATAIAEWKDDIKKDGYDLAANLVLTVLKTIIVAALVTAIVALFVVGAMVLAGLSISVLAIGILTIATGVLVNYAVEAADKKLGKIASSDETNTDGLSSVVAPYLRKAGEAISDSWDYLMEKFPNDYKEWSF